MTLFDLAIFDYDGVLVNSLDAVIRAGSDYCRSTGQGRLPDKETITALHPMTYDQLGRSIGLLSDRIESFSAFVFSRLQQAAPSVPFYPGIAALLRQRAPENTVIVSGHARKVIADKLAAHALDTHVAGIFGAYEPGDKTEKIIRACALVGADQARTCMIGDSVSDIQYARKAGLTSIAAAWGWQSQDTLAGENPDYITESVAELAALLA